jgi:hypothetical protein
MPGTLQLLAFAKPEARTHVLDEALFLAWDGQPIDASSAPLLEEVDLGDYECAPLPAQPDGPGLWLLRWAYEVVPHPEARGLTTAKYARTCTWTRPTIEDLTALGALPTLAG